MALRLPHLLRALHLRACFVLCCHDGPCKLRLRMLHVKRPQRARDVMCKTDNTSKESRSMLVRCMIKWVLFNSNSGRCSV